MMVGYTAECFMHTFYSIFCDFQSGQLYPIDAQGTLLGYWKEITELLLLYIFNLILLSLLFLCMVYNTHTIQELMFIIHL